MKRIFIIFIAAMMALGGMAKTTIQNTFMGIKLGKASQEEVQRVLASQGFELQTDTGGFYMYHGNCQVEGVPVNKLVTRFLDDTLTMMVFGNACENSCDSLKRIIDTNVENKYGFLQSGDSSTFIKMLVLGSDIPLDAKFWSRMDEETSFMYTNSDSGYVFIYLAENFMWHRLAKSFNEVLKESSPDYAEENKVTGVAGVKFGDEKNRVRQVISAKAQKLLESDAHSLDYYKVKIGGTTYDYATFFFADGKGLVSVNLQSKFYSWSEEEARMAYENVISQYRRKYTNFKVIKDEPNEKASSCGAFIDGYDYLPILITFHKSLSRGGDIMYYIQVDYYYSRRDSLYDDEI